MRKKTVALYQQILTKSELRGPTYFFPLFNKAYQQSTTTNFKLIYLLKTDNFELLKASARNREFEANNIIVLKEHYHRFKKTHEAIDLLLACIKYRISLIQVASFTLDDPFHQLKLINRLSFFIRTKLSITITYNGHSEAFFQHYKDRFEKYTEYHRLFKKIKWHGVLSWYNDVFRFVNESRIFGKSPVVSTVENRFCDTEVFHPVKKEKIIFWAGALEKYKHPEFFLHALRDLKTNQPQILSGWKFIMLGSGPMKEQISQFIEQNQLQDSLTLVPAQPDYFKLVNTCMAHVATQELDHFPSLVINEAMAGGCAILATNVGRIALYVNDGENGYLSPTENAEGIREILLRFLQLSDEDRNKMMSSSRRLCEKEHSAAKFIDQIDRFWGEVLR